MKTKYIYILFYLFILAVIHVIGCLEMRTRSWTRGTEKDMLGWAHREVIFWNLNCWLGDTCHINKMPCHRRFEQPASRLYLYIFFPKSKLFLSLDLTVYQKALEFGGFLDPVVWNSLALSLEWLDHCSRSLDSAVELYCGASLRCRALTRFVCIWICELMILIGKFCFSNWLLSFGLDVLVGEVENFGDILRGPWCFFGIEWVS